MYTAKDTQMLLVFIFRNLQNVGLEQGGKNIVLDQAEFTGICVDQELHVQYARLNSWK